MGMTNPSEALEYFQALIEDLDRYAGFVGQTKNLLKVWLCFAYHLLGHIACPLLDHIAYSLLDYVLNVSFTIIFAKNQKMFYFVNSSKDIFQPFL